MLADVHSPFIFVTGRVHGLTLRWNHARSGTDTEGRC